MSTLSIKNHNLYEKIGRTEISLPEFVTFLKQLMFNNKSLSSHWFYVLYIGTFGYQHLDKAEQGFQELGVWDSSKKEDGAFQEKLRSFDRGFGRWD